MKTWEQRKLDNVAEFSKGRGYSKGDLIELGTPIILYGRLYTNYETSISDVDTYVEAKMVLYTVEVERLLFRHQVNRRRISQELLPLINQAFCLVEI